MSDLPGWSIERDEVHREHYDRLDVLWTEIGIAWNLVDDDAVSDAIGESNDHFLEYGHYALTKSSFDVQSPEASNSFREEAKRIYQQALRRTAEVWQLAAGERLAAAKRELDRTLNNIGTDTRQAWKLYEDAAGALTTGGEHLTAAENESARDSLKRSAELAHAAVVEISKERTRGARQRRLTVVTWIVVFAIGLLGTLGTIVTLVLYLSGK